VQQLQSFGQQLIVDIGGAGDIAFRPVNTGNESNLNGGRLRPRRRSELSQSPPSPPWRPMVSIAAGYAIPASPCTAEQIAVRDAARQAEAEKMADFYKRKELAREEREAAEARAARERDIERRAAGGVGMMILEERPQTGERRHPSADPTRPCGLTQFAA
jgi:hypothetical protein